MVNIFSIAPIFPTGWVRGGVLNYDSWEDEAGIRSRCRALFFHICIEKDISRDYRSPFAANTENDLPSVAQETHELAKKSCIQNAGLYRIEVRNSSIALRRIGI